MRWKRRSRVQDLALDDGDWTFTNYFSLVDTLHDWHMRPSAFGLCRAEDDLALMSAFTATVARMRAWERQEEERRVREETEKARRKLRG